MYRNKNLTIVFLYLIALGSYSIVFLDDKDIYWLCKEDGVVENIGTLFFLIASLAFFACYFSSSGSGNYFLHVHTRRNVFYFLLGLLLFISFGEEISWGQRIFSWKTPELFNEMNFQKETNLHNIWFLDTKYLERHSLPVIFDANRLFSIFWIFILFAVPVIDRLSKKPQTLIRKTNLPVAPLWVGFLFLLHATLFHLIYTYLQDYLNLSVRLSLVELKESIYAFIILIFALHELKRGGVRYTRLNVFRSHHSRRLQLW